MKRYFCLVVAVCALLRGAWAAEPTMLFTTTDSPRMSSSGYIDWAQVSTSRGARLISVFGYNSGPQQWVQLYNSSNGIVVVIADSTASTKLWSASSSNIFIGEPLQFTNTIGTAAAGIYFARPITNSSLWFQLYDTRAHAINTASTTGILTPSTDGLSGNVHQLPRHTFAVAATDNFSFIVPDTGMQFGQGIVVAASTTGPTFTPPSTNITICATLLQ
jgi:hypothetical protein